MPRDVPAPSISKASFACPHCGAHATQRWFDLYMVHVSRGARKSDTPYLIDIDKVREALKKARDDPDDVKSLKHILRLGEQQQTGLPFVESNGQGFHDPPQLWNVYASRCFTCNDVALWVHDRLIYPPEHAGVEPNPDLPDDIRADVNEARAIVNVSPRGAAALLRLAVQKLCKLLNESGQDINKDIASLVKKGLSPVVQQALDSVRVVGNNAVHPGQMDLKDDRDTVMELLEVINLIADQLITQPKRVQELYAKLPQDKRDAIDKRDGAAPANPTKT